MSNIDTNQKWNGGIKETTPINVVGEATDQVKDKVAQVGRAATEKVDQGRTGAANALQGSAQSVRTAGQSSGEAVTNAANKTAETIESTATYLREHDFQGMLADVREVIRRNPTPSLLVGIAVGFFAGAALRRR